MLISQIVKSYYWLLKFHPHGHIPLFSSSCSRNCDFCTFQSTLCYKKVLQSKNPIHCQMHQLFGRHHARFDPNLALLEFFMNFCLTPYFKFFWKFITMNCRLQWLLTIYEMSGRRIVYERIASISYLYLAFTL